MTRSHYYHNFHFAVFLQDRLEERGLSWLCEKLGPYAHKWKEIAQALRFTPAEIQNIEATPRLLHGAPSSWLREMLFNWIQWTPGNVRGSRDYATIESLRKALRSRLVGLGNVAQDL